jgi:hypothetical protein
MTGADEIPVGLGIAGGLAVGLWSLGEKLRAMSHDRAVARLKTEEDDHDVTRHELAEARRRIAELEAQLSRKP